MKLPWVLLLTSMSFGGSTWGEKDSIFYDPIDLGNGPPANCNTIYTEWTQVPSHPNSDSAVYYTYFEMLHKPVKIEVVRTKSMSGKVKSCTMTIDTLKPFLLLHPEVGCDEHSVRHIAIECYQQN